jgi:hypothetical protein
MSAVDFVMPELDPVAVDRLIAYLRGKAWSQRPSEATARVLQLMVRLWEDRHPFPTRAEVAAHAQVSVPTVDLVLRRHKTGEIVIVYEGGVPTVRGRRWVVPSEEIRAVGRSSPARNPSRAPYKRRGMGEEGSRVGA